MRVLVTGGTGFLGRNLVHLLCREGYNVTILHRPTSKKVGLPEGVSYKIGDVTAPETLTGCCDGYDWVFHVAGDVTWGKVLQAKMMRINLEGTKNIAREAMARGVKRFVYTSSAAAIGLPKREEADETYVFNGDQLKVGYAIAKRRAEEFVLSLVREGLPAVVVNPSVMIGIRTYKPNFVRSVLKGKLFVSPPGGLNVCDVEDVARGHLLAALKGEIGERYILGGTNLPLIDLLQKVADEAQLGRVILPVPTFLARTAAWLEEGVSVLTRQDPGFAWDLAKLAGRDLFYSSHKAIQKLGYSITPLEETIAKTVAWEQVFEQFG
jgi:dihydroflavonol-4-reductase